MTLGDGQMKNIINLTDRMLIIRGMTIGEGAQMPVVNEEILEWPEIKDLLSQEKIRIEKSDSCQSDNSM